MSCPFCKTDHPHCDSPGAIVSRTTGCPEWDGPKKPPTEREQFLQELRKRVDQELQGAIW